MKMTAYELLINSQTSSALLN